MNRRDDGPATVVEGLVSVTRTVLVIVLLMAFGFGLTPYRAYADDASPTASPSSSPSNQQGSGSDSITVTSNITDTENLLGDSVSAVSDKIAATHRSSGVTVKLLYLSTFGDHAKPETWASQVLESTNPKPNTVMLAVASNDGSLVVVVSSNSDEWLKSRKTADLLSAAALKPIMKDSPDWAGSAMAMMTEIDTLKQTSTSTMTSRVGVIVLIVVLLALALLVAVVLILRRRGISLRPRRSAGRHAPRDPTA
jgi:hypothetical protein